MQLQKSDYDKYDLFIGMDSANIRNMLRVFGGDPAGKVHKLMDFTDRGGDVADPWYSERFDVAYRDISDGCTALLDAILKRREELAVTLSVGNVFMDVIHEYSDITVHLTLFNAAIANGVPQKLEHNDIRWIMPSEIPNYTFCPADEEILAKICEVYK